MNDTSKKTTEFILKPYLFEKDDFVSVSRRCHYNKFISDFYERMAEENGMPYLDYSGKLHYGKDPNLLKVSKDVFDCCKFWNFDYFEQAKSKVFVKVKRCKNRYCLNCQSMAADQRYAQYGKVLDEYVPNYDLYHIVFTVPNVSAERLAATLQLMIDKFAYMIRYFDGRKGIRGVNLKFLGYVGCAREIEITISKKDGSYHPHIHSIWILKKGLNFQPTYFNSFSIDRTGRNPDRYFTELELLFQRMWCLLITRTTVNKENLNDIGKVTGYPDGFSCTADLSNGDYHEIFKYAIKGTFKEETLFKYDTFKTLYKALFGKEAYATYGCLFRYDFNKYDDNLGLKDPDYIFGMILNNLRGKELPKRVEDTLGKILRSYESGVNIKYISKAAFVKHFKALSEEDKELYIQELLEELNEEVG